MDVQFKCPCGTVLTAPENDVHKTIACHSCGRILVVPAMPVAAGIGAKSQEEELVEAEALPQDTSEGYLDDESALKPHVIGVSGLAVAALVLGIVGPFLGILSALAGLLAVIFGAISVRTITRTPELPGKGMAVAGIVLGALNVLLWLTFIYAAVNTQRQADDQLDVVFTFFTGGF